MTDAATQAAAEAFGLSGCVPSVEERMPRAVAAARPIIEAELRARIAAEVRAEVAATAPVVEIVETLGQPTTCRVTVEGVVRFIGQSHPLDGDFTRGYREGYIDADNGYAARIARGGAS